MDRFWDKVNKTDDCWLWLGARHNQGYGHFRLNGKIEKAHRVSYRFVVGDIPKGLQLDHLCKNVACVNPYHLEPVTNRENTSRGRLHTGRKQPLPVGVSRFRQRYLARKMLDGVYKHLGSFTTIEDAKAAYDRA